MNNRNILIEDSCEEDLVLEPDVELFANGWHNYEDTYRPSRAKMNANSYWRYSDNSYIMVSVYTCTEFITKVLCCMDKLAFLVE